MGAYRELERRFARVTNLRHAEAMLEWDLVTQMPAGAAESRADQIATLLVIAHEILTDTKTLTALEAARDEVANDPWREANVREMSRQARHATALDSSLVEALAKANTACEQTWREARPEDDFAAIRPQLERVLALYREAAQAKAEALGRGPYEALLDVWEPDGRTALIDPLFDDLAAFLPGFIDQVVERQAARPPALPLHGPFPLETQRGLGERLMGALGFEFTHGRLDTSLHPFCGGTPDDVRITTRYDERDFTSGLMGVLHETGHALYERGLPAEWRLQPVGQARGMSIHESQSLLIEMQACRTPEFLAFAAPLMREAFAGEGPAWEPENLHRLYTRVGRSLIRVEADEATYPAHVILRYRLERAMIEGGLEIADLPEAWRAGMAALVGIEPPDDRTGCLQDIHWYGGAWGYFPCYTLGAITAAQLFEAAIRDEPDALPGIARGDFRPLLGWLRPRIHGKGSLASTDEMIREATGGPLDPAVYKRHLTARYLESE